MKLSLYVNSYVEFSLDMSRVLPEVKLNFDIRDQPMRVCLILQSQISSSHLDN